MRGWRSALAFGLALAVAGAALARETERSKQRRSAEAERAGLQQKLQALKRDIGRTEAAKSHAADELAESEKAISDANRELYALAQEQKEAETKLRKLTEEHARLTANVAARQKQLGQILRDQYVAGNEDRLKLLLSGDNPNRINRDLQYMGYVSQAQAKLIEGLRESLRELEANKEEAEETRAELEEIATEQRQQKAKLERDKGRRAALLAQLSNKLAAQRKQVGNIERDERRLAGLVDRLTKLIEEQRKAEAAAREKRRQEQLARAREQSERAANTAVQGKSRRGQTNPDAIEDDEPPPKVLARNELTPVASVQDGGAARAFSALRGRLRLPVKGELTAKFGSKRGDGPSWKGLFIRTEEGAEVKAVADGQVVFAEWLRGFGNLVIIDHGSQYMTIYGNNQAVLKQAGEMVKTGEIIANAGNSGGSEQSGLYFEMRHQGRAFDPLEWVTIR